MSSSISRILVTGAFGQIGSELIPALCRRYGKENVVTVDVRAPSEGQKGVCAQFYTADVTDRAAMEEIVTRYKIDTVFHMAALLSAVGEKNPQLCWHVNMDGTLNILEIGLAHKMKRVIIPSSIAVWGAGVPQDNTPQETVLKPTTMYGVTKVCGELLGDYYFKKFGLEVRGLRYPGIISYETPPGGGTTDYAVAIYYEAIDKGHYTCFVREDTVLPMMYMPDAINAILQLAEADSNRLNRHCDYNLASMSFSAGELASAIKKHLPNFKVAYEPDFHQAIADSWPRSIDDSAARHDWDWKPEWNLQGMTVDMLKHLKERKEKGTLYR